MSGAQRAACAAAMLSAVFAAGCGNATPAATAADASSAAVTERAGTLSVTAFRLSGWHDDSFHYLPALSVRAAAIGRPVFVQRVDFTADDPGTRRLLKGVRYSEAKRVQPGDTVELVSDAEAGDASEIASPLALAAVSAIITFVDDEGHPGIVSAVGVVPPVTDRASHASVAIKQFAVTRRQHLGRVLYWPKLTLVETSGRNRASIRKIVFELLDVGAAGQVRAAWSVPAVQAGETLRLDTRKDGRAPWFEIDSSADASRVAVAISFVDDEGRGGLVRAVAAVPR